jgi:hypothetical protein
MRSSQPRLSHPAPSSSRPLRFPSARQRADRTLRLPSDGPSIVLHAMRHQAATSRPEQCWPPRVRQTPRARPASVVLPEQEPQARRRCARTGRARAMCPSGGVRSTSMTTTQAIIDSIDDRVRALNEQIGTLTTARAALTGGDPRAIKRPRRNTTRAAASTDGPATDSRVEPQARSVSKRPSERSRPARKTSLGLAKPTRRRKGRADEAVTPERLELLLSDNGGMTTSALAERAGGSRDQILTLLRQLEATGRIRRTGQRRSTRWHAITDEERIHKRAAELAALSKKTA